MVSSSGTHSLSSLKPRVSLGRLIMVVSLFFCCNVCYMPNSILTYDSFFKALDSAQFHDEDFYSLSQSPTSNKFSYEGNDDVSENGKNENSCLSAHVASNKYMTPSRKSSSVANKYKQLPCEG